jgi:hypothetical protein
MVNFTSFGSDGHFNPAVATRVSGLSTGKPDAFERLAWRILREPGFVSSKDRDRAFLKTNSRSARKSVRDPVNSPKYRRFGYHHNQRSRSHMAFAAALP